MTRLSAAIDLMNQDDIEDHAERLHETFVQMMIQYSDESDDRLAAAIAQLGHAYGALLEVIADTDDACQEEGGPGTDDPDRDVSGTDAETAFRDAWARAYAHGLGRDLDYGYESYCLFTFDWDAATMPRSLLVQAGARVGAVDAQRTRQVFRALQNEAADHART